MSGKAELMFEVLSDGVVFFDPAGAARFCNRMARELFGNRVGTLFTDIATQKALAALRNGTAGFPREVKLEFSRDGESIPLDVTILDWKAGYGFVFILRRALSSDPIRGDLSIVFDLIERELKAPMEALIAATEQLVGTHPELREASSVLVERLAQLAESAELFGTDELVGTDRIGLRDVFDEAWMEIAPLAGQRYVKIAIRGLDEHLPPVYGNRKWLKRAFAEIVHNAVKHAIPGRDAQDLSVVDIEAHCDGPWLIIKVANGGMGILRDIGGRMFLPFSRARVPARIQMTGLGMGLPLARRIVEIHGGKMKLDTSLGDRVDVTLMLPTGGTPTNLARMEIEQAQRYAEDLAKLLARRAKREPAKNY